MEITRAVIFCRVLEKLVDLLRGLNFSEISHKIGLIETRINLCPDADKLSRVIPAVSFSGVWHKSSSSASAGRIQPGSISILLKLEF